MEDVNDDLLYVFIDESGGDIKYVKDNEPRSPFFIWSVVLIGRATTRRLGGLWINS